MDRKEAYALIKRYDLAEEVQDRFGNNYTRVSTDKLEQVIWDYDATLVPGDEEDEVEVIAEPKKKEAITIEDAYETACVAFLAILKDSGKLDNLLKLL